MVPSDRDARLSGAVAPTPATASRDPSSALELLKKGLTMSDVSLDELGPVDYTVVEFPAGASNFTGEMTAELLAWSTRERSASSMS